MAEAITKLIELQRHMNEIELEFDLRRALLDQKQENVLKEAYNRRTRIILGIKKAESYEGESIASHDNNYAGKDSNLNNCGNGLGKNCDNVIGKTSWLRVNKSSEVQTRDGCDHEKADLKGFWYTVLMNSKQISCLIQDHDREALSYLVDVSSTTDTSRLKSEKIFSFTIGFHFASNPFLHDSVLTKEYFVKIMVENGNTIQYYGPRIFRSVGCVINWKPGMDLTKRSSPHRPPRNSSLPNIPTFTSTQTTQNSSTQQLRIKEWVSSGEKDSFFNYFSFPDVPEDLILDEADEALLNKDFQQGWHIKDDIIPQALFYFLGDVSDSESDDLSETDSSSINNDYSSRGSVSSSESPRRCRCKSNNVKICGN